MTEKTQNPDPEAPETVIEAQQPEASETVIEAPQPEAPQPDPVLMRQQQYQQQYQDGVRKIMDLRQQKSIIEDMLTEETMQQERIRGALSEIAYQITQKE